MRVTEAMVGDLVKFRCFDGSIIFGQVVEIHSDIVYLKSTFGRHWSKLKDIEPIPLTPEILEKYGFKKQSEGRFLLEDLENNYWVKFYSKDTNYTRGAYNYIDLDCGCMSIREMPIEFLHELQHALKLCSINCEIIL